MAEYTTFAGLYKLDPGDPISLNNYQYFENEAILDQYMQSFTTHRHNGAPAMADFAAGPTLTPSASGGQLDPQITYYVGITAVDVYGGETAAYVASAETLGTVLNPTTAPTAVAGSGGTLNLGVYRYAYTLTDDYGETLISPQINVSVGNNGKVTLGLPAASNPKRVYRAFGYGDFNKVSDVASGVTTFVDDGTLCQNCDQSPPEENTAGATNKITIQRPSLPASAALWRVYVSEEVDLSNPSSLHAYSSANVRDIPSAVTSVDFTTDVQIRLGTPPTVSRTIPGASLIYAVDVLYEGNGPYLGSGSVEGGLDDLSVAVSVATERVRSMRSSPNNASAAIQGDVLLVGSNGMTIAQSPASAVGSGASGTFTFSASRFRHGSTGGWSFGDMSFNSGNAGGNASGTTVNVAGSAITFAGQRMAFGSGAAPNYQEAQDHWTPPSGSGTTISQVSTGGNDYRVDIRGMRLTASATPPTYLGHRDVFIPSTFSVNVQETASAGATQLAFSHRSGVAGMFAAPISFTPSFPADAGKQYMASGITMILPSGATDGTEISIKKIALGGGTALTVTASGDQRLEGILGGSTVIPNGGSDSLLFRYSSQIPGYWLV